MRSLGYCVQNASHCLPCHVMPCAGCGMRGLGWCVKMHPIVFHTMSCHAMPCGSTLWFEVLRPHSLSPMPSAQVFDRCVKGFRRLDQPFGTKPMPSNTEKPMPNTEELDVRRFAGPLRTGHQLDLTIKWWHPRTLEYGYVWRPARTK